MFLFVFKSYKKSDVFIMVYFLDSLIFSWSKSGMLFQIILQVILIAFTIPIRFSSRRYSLGCLPSVITVHRQVDITKIINTVSQADGGRGEQPDGQMDTMSCHFLSDFTCLPRTAAPKSYTDEWSSSSSLNCFIMNQQNYQRSWQRPYNF